MVGRDSHKVEAVVRFHSWLIMERIIFLDIDGVLNSAQSVEQFETFDRFCPIAVQNLERILSETKALIVLSSAWRCDDSKRFPDVLVDNGVISAKTQYLAQTPYIMGQRALEIKTWMEANNFSGKFVILDDTHVPGFSENLCKIDSLVGLSEKDADKAIQILTN